MLRTPVLVRPRPDWWSPYPTRRADLRPRQRQRIRPPPVSRVRMIQPSRAGRPKGSRARSDRVAGHRGILHQPDRFLSLPWSPHPARRVGLRPHQRQRIRPPPVSRVRMIQPPRAGRPQDSRARSDRVAGHLGVLHQPDRFLGLPVWSFPRFHRRGCLDGPVALDGRPPVDRGRCAHSGTLQSLQQRAGRQIQPKRGSKVDGPIALVCSSSATAPWCCDFLYGFWVAVFRMARLQMSHAWVAVCSFLGSWALKGRPRTLEAPHRQR